MTWEKGRQLKKFDNNTYTYNANGIRTSKTVGGVKHEYILDGTKILRETWGSNTLIPLYDNEDSVCGILYNNVPYYFVKNLQSDVIAIVDKDAKTVARYSYDAWGACTVKDSAGTENTSATFIGNINPFRYRGYYYDDEIGMYYLQSRYYDPLVGRFINADSEYVFNITCYGVGVLCFYNYCCNDPVNRMDDTGNWFLSAIRAAVTAVRTVHDVVAGSIKTFVTARVKGYTALQTTLSLLINAGIAIVKNVFLHFIEMMRMVASFLRKVLEKLVEGFCAFLSEMGGQWIEYGDISKVNWMKCLKVGLSGIAFSFVDNGLQKYRDEILTKLLRGLLDANFAKKVIYEIYVVLFVDLPQNVINSLI